MEKVICSMENSDASSALRGTKAKKNANRNRNNRIIMSDVTPPISERDATPTARRYKKTAHPFRDGRSFKSRFRNDRSLRNRVGADDYIMPPMPWSWPWASGASGSGMSEIRHSVVRRRPEIEAAFCRAERVTLVGSTTPPLTRSS